MFHLFTELFNGTIFSEHKEEAAFEVLNAAIEYLNAHDVWPELDPFDISLHTLDHPRQQAEFQETVDILEFIRGRKPKSASAKHVSFN